MSCSEEKCASCPPMNRTTMIKLTKILMMRSFYDMKIPISPCTMAALREIADEVEQFIKKGELSAPRVTDEDIERLMKGPAAEA